MNSVIAREFCVAQREFNATNARESNNVGSHAGRKRKSVRDALAAHPLEQRLIESDAHAGAARERCKFKWTRDRVFQIFHARWLNPLHEFDARVERHLAIAIKPNTSTRRSSRTPSRPIFIFTLATPSNARASLSRSTSATDACTKVAMRMCAAAGCSMLRR